MLATRGSCPAANVIACVQSPRGCSLLAVGGTDPQPAGPARQTDRAVRGTRPSASVMHIASCVAAWFAVCWPWLVPIRGRQAGRQSGTGTQMPRVCASPGGAEYRAVLTPRPCSACWLTPRAAGAVAPKPKPKAKPFKSVSPDKLPPSLRTAAPAPKKFAAKSGGATKPGDPPPVMGFAELPALPRGLPGPPSTAPPPLTKKPLPPPPKRLPPPPKGPPPPERKPVSCMPDVIHFATPSLASASLAFWRQR